MCKYVQVFDRCHIWAPKSGHPIIGYPTSGCQIWALKNWVPKFAHPNLGGQICVPMFGYPKFGYPKFGYPKRPNTSNLPNLSNLFLNTKCSNTFRTTFDGF